MKDNWIRIIDQTKDFNTIKNAPKQFYNVLCKSGKIRTALPEFDKDNDDLYFETMTGARGLIYCNEIIAYQPIFIPEDLIQKVLSNKQIKKSYFQIIYETKSNI